jgi:hypothetical protein
LPDLDAGEAACIRVAPDTIATVLQRVGDR